MSSIPTGSTFWCRHLCARPSAAELARLGFGAAAQPGAIAIGLEGDWLDRFGTRLAERGRHAERQLRDRDMPAPNDAERMLEHAIDLHNAVWRFVDVAPAWTRLQIFGFRYTAVADERRDGMIWFGVNHGTGALLDGGFLVRLRTALTQEPEWLAPDDAVRRAAGQGWDAAAIRDRLQPAIEHRVRRDLEPFLRAARRRLERDRARIWRYHDDLRRTAQGKLQVLDLSTKDKAASGGKAAADGKVAADRQRETMRITAIEREYAAKLQDLRHNYALRLSVEWVQTVAVFAPVQRCRVLIKRRKGERSVAIDWHPTVRALEPLVSDWGSPDGNARLVCDDRLHLTPPAGQAACTACGRPWCHACHPQACPRCAAATA